jgi:hypothetical protein
MSKNPSAVALGKMTSAKKAESSRRNGALGGYRKHKFTQCPDCDKSFKGDKLPQHTFCGVLCSGSPALDSAPFADLPESPARDKALDNWRKS